MNKEAWTFKNIFQRQTKLAAYIIICATLVVIGASYALFFQVDSNSNNQIIEAGTLTFVYSNESVIDNTTCFQPMNLDEANLYASQCSYQLSIKNTGTLAADYNLFLVPREDNTADLSNLKLILRQNGTPVTGYPKGIVSGTGDSTHVGTTNAFLTGNIYPGNTVLFSAQIYVDDTTNFAGSENKKVSFDIRGALAANDENPINTKKTTASETLASLQMISPGLTVTPPNSANPDFSIIAPRAANVNNDGKAEQTSGIFEAEDDYGTSYYFRGNVSNNYVKFAGFYWRIIRINGNGTVRMIYAGDASVIDNLPNKLEVLANGYDDSITEYTKLGTSKFNANSNDNAYIGYMYGTAGSNNYADTHANTNNSTIKTYLDTWYENNLKNTINEGFIADSIFCNDRSVASQETIEYINNTYNPSVQYTANAFGTNNTIYGASGRQIEQFEQELGNKATLMCPQKNDAFTVYDTIHGNGSLTYPIGLITIDEANIAGGAINGNNNYYLKTGYYYWTMSPKELMIYNVKYNGDINQDNIEGIAGVRPVINLKPGSIINGNGTATNPFRIDSDLS